MVTVEPTKEEIFAYLSEIVDPEIPVVTIQEIGMLRDVHINEQSCEVVLTPTYTGCPAMGIIEADIKALLQSKGIRDVTIKMVYDPAWTSDWITEEAKNKIRAYGIAPPKSCAGGMAAEKHIQCPRCESEDTIMVSRYGATACKAMYKCNNCSEPFEYFKCH